MHLIVNTKWHMTVWRPARSRWPTIVTVHPALESWSAGEPFGCPVSDSPLIHPSFLASITQSQEGIQRRNTFIHVILNIHRNQSYLWLPWGFFRHKSWLFFFIHFLWICLSIVYDHVLFFCISPSLLFFHLPNVLALNPFRKLGVTFESSSTAQVNLSLEVIVD